MTNNIKRREASLVFRGFSCPPEFIEEIIGIKADAKGIRGMPIRPEIKTILKRSFAIFSIPFDPDTRLDEIIPKIISEFGGVDKLISVRELVNPEFFKIDILWPVKDSDDQDGGFICSSSIAELDAMKCTLAFGFL